MTRSRTAPLLPALLLASLVAALPSLASAAPALLGERAVSTFERRPASGFDTPLVPLATNGSTFFTAWVETRGGESAVYGARIAPSGRVLDPSGLRLAATDATFGKTAVAGTLRDFVVFAPESSGIVVAPVRGDRALPAVHLSAPRTFSIDTAAWNGSHYALVVRGKDASGAVIATLLVLGPDFSVERTLPLTTPMSATATASLVVDGSGFLLLYENYSASTDTVFVQHLDAAGALAGAPLIVPTGAPGTRMFGSYWPAIAPDGNGGFTIAWMNGRIYGVALSSAGAFGAPCAISDEEGTFPSIAWNGREHLVTWTTVAAGEDGLFRLDGARIDASGAIHQAGTLATSNLGWAEASLAGIPTGFLGVWFGNVIGDAEHDSLASRYYAQHGPLLAAGTSTLLAAWGEGGAIYAARLRPDGTPIDAAGIRLGLPQSTGDVAPLAVASTGSVYLVAWRRADGQVAVSRIREDGAVLDPSGGTALTSPGTSLVAASDGADFLLVWSNGGTLTSMRVPATGAIPAAPAPPFASRFAETPLALVWNGASYALLWQQALEGDPFQQQRISPLDREGRLLGTAIIGVNLGMHGMERAGDELLVAYTSGATTYTQRFARSGEPSSERMPVLQNTSAPILTPTLDGFALLFTTGAEEVDAMLLDAAGAPHAPPSIVLRKSGVQLTDALFAHGTTRVAYTAPQASAETAEPLARAFTGELRVDAATARRRRVS